MQSAADVARKWSRNLGTAGDAMRAGIQGVTVNPAEKAAQRQDAYVAGVQRAVADGKYQRGLRRVTLAMWQDAMLTKGLNRIAAGASAAQPKMEAFLQKWLPHQEALKTKLQSMPRGDLQQNIARAIAAIQHNAGFKYT